MAAMPLWTGRGENAGVIVATAVALSGWGGMLLAMGVCQSTVGLMRPMGWVGVALGIYILVASHHELLALGGSLLILLCSAPLCGIIQPHELRAVRKRYGL